MRVCGSNLLWIHGHWLPTEKSRRVPEYWSVPIPRKWDRLLARGTLWLQVPLRSLPSGAPDLWIRHPVGSGTAIITR